MNRTRPGRRVVDPRPTIMPVSSELNAPSPGCCRPFPDGRFVNQELVELYAHHQGPRCKGFMEPMNIKEWMGSWRGGISVPQPVPELSRAQRLEMKAELVGRHGDEFVGSIGRSYLGDE